MGCNNSIFYAMHDGNGDNDGDDDDDDEDDEMMVMMMVCANIQRICSYKFNPICMGGIVRSSLTMYDKFVLISRLLPRVFLLPAQLNPALLRHMPLTSIESLDVQPVKKQDYFYYLAT